ARGDMASRFRIIDANGDTRWVMIQSRPLVNKAGELTDWVGSLTDITAELDSMAHLQRLSEVLEATPDLVAMNDIHGTFTYANAAMRLRFGLDDESLPT